MSPLKILFLLAFMLVVTGFIVFVERGQKDPCLLRQESRAGRSTVDNRHLPIKVNTGR